MSDFGADLFPLKKPSGAYGIPPGGRGTNWAWPGRSTLALLAPGPDGPVATERFEILREGLELTEALLFIELSIAEKELGDGLLKRARSVLDARSRAFRRGWFGSRYIQSEQDEKLLDLAGEVAKELR